jgi:hypothetical protein
MSKILRTIGIVLMGLTAAFTLASGAGTTCVALAAENFGESMAPIAPYKWLYIIFVIVTIAIGVMGVRAVVLLNKGRPNAYRYSVIFMLLGIFVGAIHMAVSRALRGSSMPVDGVVYTTVLTLIVFLIFRIPTVWIKVGFEKSARDDDSGPKAAAITLLLSGALFLTVQYWAGPTHTWDGVNWADAWHLSMAVVGWGLALAGMGILIIPLIRRKGTEPIPAAVPGQQP